jgi:hypothetical protein
VGHYSVITAGGGGGGGQAWQVDRIPVESANGSLTVFTLPSSHTYIAGTLVVAVNGQQLTKTDDWSETTSSTFTFVTPPLSGDKIRLMYRTA